MPVTIETLDNGRGVVIRHYARVTSEELTANSRNIADQLAGGAPILYGLIDYSDIEIVDFDAEAMWTAANNSLQAALGAPKMVWAVAAPSSHSYALANIWKTISTRTGWHSAVFDTRDDAVDWLARTAGDVHGLTPSDVRAHLMDMERGAASGPLSHNEQTG